ncbi:glycoside hydrolase family 32 protein [Parafilimonas sp.]|uniref:glycoside hydrolase family 32 protein n=1 Tax=Parafilimonas sp. TaxID=1969739 RepID=UPI0039E22EC0
MKSSFILFICLLLATANFSQQAYHEQYRPQIHFSPKEHWTNDPNGMVYYSGAYHLFFQYYPDGITWGPMHWGHAISKDLVHWEELPIALYPDSLGYIFSGSAVVDAKNTSGFGKDGKLPLVAIFTHHDPKGEKAGSSTFQNQSLAYSLDDGKTWIKYEGNPVLKNPGITDFRDPKVMWYEPQQKWVMTLAAKDHISFYASPDLKNWMHESDFGKDIGAHGGVWECPDLIPFDVNGKKMWVLIVNINPGGPNGGSATQYFTGSFDGKIFIPNHTNIKWLDYGPDEYAGITWSNTGNRKIFLGWMSNWLYANLVPTVKWRNAMTIPRDISLKKINNTWLAASEPSKELKAIELKTISLNNIKTGNGLDLSSKTGNIQLPCRINLNFDKAADFSLTLSNTAGEKIIIGFDKQNNQYFIDRSNSGKTDFQKDFAAKHTAPRFINTDAMNISLIIDESAVELFADDGLSVMTSIFFSSAPYNKAGIQADEMIKRLEYVPYKSIWP